MDEIVGEATVERLLRVHLERVGTVANRGLGIFRPAFKDGVELLTVVGRHILHIIRVFQPTFDLEAGDAGIQQLLKMGAVVQVFQAEQVFAFNQHLTLRVEQIPWQSAGLGTGAAVGRAVADILAQIALSTVADTQ